MGTGRSWKRLSSQPFCGTSSCQRWAPARTASARWGTRIAGSGGQKACPCSHLLSRWGRGRWGGWSWWVHPILSFPEPRHMVDWEPPLCDPHSRAALDGRGESRWCEGSGQLTENPSWRHGEVWNAGLLVSWGSKFPAQIQSLLHVSLLRNSGWWPKSWALLSEGPCTTSLVTGPWSLPWV